VRTCSHKLSCPISSASASAASNTLLAMPRPR
jgi:hypothetical protein